MPYRISRKQSNIHSNKKIEALFRASRASILLKQSVYSYELDALFFFISSSNRFLYPCHDSFLLSSPGGSAFPHAAREISSYWKESF